MKDSKEGSTVYAIIAATAIGGGSGYMTSHLVQDEREGCETFIQDARENERQNVRIENLEKKIK